MVSILHDNSLPFADRLYQMQEDSRYDVADPQVSYGQTSSEEESLPDPSLFADIHAKPAPPTVPKVFLSNQCSFNCAYCGCRASRENARRYCNTPRELAEIALTQAKDNGHGIFITSAIYRNANYTQEIIIETLRVLRKELYYDGYIHAKIMPGVDPLLIEKTGRYANRLSVNIEVAQNAGYERIAKQKNKENILVPMQQISNLVRDSRQYRSKSSPLLAKSQTTQLMAGSSEESDRTIMRLSKALYHKYNLSRVYYTAFHYQDKAKGYDELPFTQVPIWRVKRLYQADRLLQLYDFSPDDITPEQSPDLCEHLDPKMSWALRNIHQFPVEINNADYEQLLRIPGIGITYAQKIIRARRYGLVTHQTLRKIGISLKKSTYFLTCNGKYEGGNLLSNPEVLSQLFSEAPNNEVLPLSSMH
ncbi:MAG: putative modification/repair radical protein [Herbinix sp.]|nr:putative modification/repair radical protein [Herbinix sp.]